jgi:hypothetical protein
MREKDLLWRCHVSMSPGNAKGFQPFPAFRTNQVNPLWKGFTRLWSRERMRLTTRVILQQFFLSFFLLVKQKRQMLVWETKKDWGQPYEIGQWKCPEWKPHIMHGPKWRWPLTTWLLMGIITCVVHFTPKMKVIVNFVLLFMDTSLLIFHYFYKQLIDFFQGN